MRMEATFSIQSIDGMKRRPGQGRLLHYANRNYLIS
jgi:hypothetical protein